MIINPQPARLSPLNRFTLLSLFLALTVLTVAGCQGQRAGLKAPGYTYTRLNPINDQDQAQNQTSLKQNLTVEEVLKRAYSQTGRPYRFGGNSPETGFDCSGFVRWVYSPLGVNLPRRSREMLAVGTPVAVSDLRPGDLVFFNYGYSHVGIYTGHGSYIHSPRTGKRVEESPLAGAGRGNRMVGARRIISNHDAAPPDPALKNIWMAKAEEINNRLPLPAMKKGRRGRTAQVAVNAGARTRKGAVTSAKNAKISAPASKKSGKTKTHQVAQGDTLYVLAQKHGVSTEDLKKANNLQGKKSTLRPGQKLVIPAKAADKTGKGGKKPKGV